MHRDHIDQVRRFLVAVEQDHPGPRSDHEPAGRPPTGQLRTSEREGFQHSGQLVERRPFAASRLGQALLRPLPGAGHGIEDPRDASCIRVCVIERRGEKRTRKSFGNGEGAAMSAKTKLYFAYA